MLLNFATKMTRRPLIWTYYSTLQEKQRNDIQIISEKPQRLDVLKSGTSEVG
jgi:hypothetical protein